MIILINYTTKGQRYLMFVGIGKTRSKSVQLQVTLTILLNCTIYKIGQACHSNFRRMSQ